MLGETQKMENSQMLLMQMATPTLVQKSVREFQINKNKKCHQKQNLESSYGSVSIGNDVCTGERNQYSRAFCNSIHQR